MSLILRAVRGAAWTIASSVGGRVIGLVSTLVLTRYISPDAYGAVAVATAIVLTADEFTQFGLLQYVVAKPHVDRAERFHASFYHLVIGVVAIAVAYLFRHPLCQAFSAPTAATFMAGLCVSSLCDRIAVAPERVLVRELRFGIVSIGRGVSEIVYAGLAIALAMLDFGGFAIVYGNIAQWGVFLLVMVFALHWREWIEPHPLKAETTKRLFAFGTPLAIGHAANVGSRRWDNLLISAFFGPAAAGKYSLAYNLADIPATHVGEHIGDVLLPSFARMAPEERRQALIRATALLALVISPLAVGLGLVAPTVTSAVFDARWASMAPMLALLSALSVFRPVGWTIGSYLQAVDQPHLVMRLEVGKVIALVLCIGALAMFGINYACIGVGIGFGLHALASLIAVSRVDRVPFGPLALGSLPPILACAPMAGAVFLTRMGLAAIEQDGTVLALVVEIVAGAICFVPSAFLIAPKVSRDFVSLVKDAIASRGDDDDDDDDDDDKQQERNQAAEPDVDA